MEIVYRNEINDGNVEFKTVLGFEGKVKNEYFPLVDLSRKDYWTLFKARLRGKLYLLVIPSPRSVNFSYEFIRIKKKRKKWFR